MSHPGGVTESLICLAPWKTGIGTSFMRLHGWENLTLMIVGSSVLEASDLKSSVCTSTFKFTQLNFTNGLDGRGHI